MIDPRITKAAEILIDHSTRTKKGDEVLIITELNGRDLALEVYKKALERGAFPRLRVSIPGEAYVLYKYGNIEQLKHFPDELMYDVKHCDVYIRIGAAQNTRELTSIDPKKIVLRQKALQAISNYVTNNLRWVIFNYPTNAYAQDAEMSLHEFEDFVFNATNIDWKKETALLNKVKKILDKGSTVWVKGEDTDLTFSIKGRKAITCSGEHNMPDGEIFIAPVDNSAKGFIKFTYPAIYGGREVDGIRLEFKNGAVVKASATKNEHFLQEIINTDKGSRYIGEFGIGVNYNIKRFVKSLLFDEKIGGTVHFALGKAYREGGGKNKSAIHWDIVKDLRANGEIYVDNKLIQKNGKFTISHF